MIRFDTLFRLLKKRFNKGGYMIFVSSACLKKNQINQVLQEYVENNIYNIELSGGTKYYEGICDDLKKYREKYDLKYVCHAYFPPPKNDFVINLASCNETIYKKSIDHYEKCIEMLRKYQIPVLSIHAGFLVEITTETIGKKITKPVIYDEKEAYERFINAYGYIAKLCDESNIDLYLENNVLSSENYKEFHYNNYFMMTDFDSIIRMKKELNFNLLLDLGHLFVSSNTLNLPFDNQCVKLKSYAKWLHISENNGIKDQHLPLVKESIITKQIAGFDLNKINITLETIGSIEEIKNSIAIIKNK